MRLILRGVCLALLLSLLLQPGCKRPETAPPPPEPVAKAEEGRPAEGEKVAAKGDATVEEAETVGTAPEPLLFVRDGDIWLLSPENPEPAQITTMGGCHSPAWKRDGTQIAFVHDTEATIEDARGEQRPVGEIWISDPTGNETSKLKMNLRNAITGLVWNQLGDGLVVVTPDAANSDVARIVMLDGTVGKKTVGCNLIMPCDYEVSPYVVVEHNYTRGYGAEECFLLGDELQHTAYATEMADLHPVIAPGLDWAAVHIAEEGESAAAKGTDYVYLIEKPKFEGPEWLAKHARGDSAKGMIAEAPGLPARAQKVYEAKRDIHSLAWSWDQKWLAFVVEEDAEMPDPAKCELWIVEAATGEAKLLLRNAREPAWKAIERHMPEDGEDEAH